MCNSRNVISMMILMIVVKLYQYGIIIKYSLVQISCIDLQNTGTTPVQVVLLGKYVILNPDMESEMIRGTPNASTRASADVDLPSFNFNAAVSFGHFFLP